MTAFIDTLGPSRRNPLILSEARREALGGVEGASRALRSGRAEARPGKSLVAGANAWFRAAESLRPAHDRILDDPYAGRFAERDPRVTLIRLARFIVPPLRRTIDELQAAHCTRHRAIDELIAEAVLRDGFEQVVTIGAGYDMRPSRLRERLPGARWLEVDHPGTQSRKLALLGEVDAAPVDRASVDLMVDPLEEALAAARFDRSRPACFVLEGLIHYLTLERLDALLAAMAAAGERVRVILSFIRTDMYESRTSTFVHLIKAVREIPRLHFTPDGLAARAARHGLGAFRSWTIEQQMREFVPHIERRPRLSQDVATVDSR